MSSTSIMNTSVSSTSPPISTSTSSGLDKLDEKNKGFYKGGVGIFILSFTMILSTLFIFRFNGLKHIFIHDIIKIISGTMLIITVALLFVSIGINARSAALMHSNNFTDNKYYSTSIIFACISVLILIIGAMSIPSSGHGHTKTGTTNFTDRDFR